LFSTNHLHKNTKNINVLRVFAQSSTAWNNIGAGLVNRKNVSRSYAALAPISTPGV